VNQEIAFEEIAGVEVSGGKMQVRKRDGRALSIGSLDAPGALRELADRLVGALS